MEGIQIIFIMISLPNLIKGKATMMKAKKAALTYSFFLNSKM